MSSSVKQQFLIDMQLAGLSESSRSIYQRAVERFLASSAVAAEEVSEAQLGEYFRGLVACGLCQGTIRPARCALEMFFQGTLGREWGLFKKRSPPSGASVCPRRPAMFSAAASSPRWSIPSIASVWL
jgi:hypothetical protein